MRYNEIMLLEKELKKFLNLNTSVIEDSLKRSFFYYEFIKVDSVEIDDNEFRASCYLNSGCGVTHSPYLPIPKEFMRIIKLNKIKNSISNRSNK